MSEHAVVIADDHPIFRRGLRDIVDSAGGYRVLAEAEDGEAAIGHIERLNPDFAILDLAMPRGDGFAVARWALANRPQTACVILTMYTEVEYLERAIELGALGFLVKDDAQDELIKCLEIVAGGEFYVSASVGRPRPRATATEPSPEDGASVDRLTPAQRQVLKELARYKTSKEIARILGISPKTVENHRLNIATELDLHGRNMLLRFAVRSRHLL
ncbi:MAG: response regulator transcription factor [Alphaproteobacteria bacterium]